MDNEQFVFGQSLKSPAGYLASISDALKHLYLTRLKGIDMNKICVATVLMEGTAEEVTQQQVRLDSIALQYRGIAAGENNGKRGYQLTFAIAYIRVRSSSLP